METFQRFSPSLINFQWPLSAEVEIKFFCISHDHTINESRDSLSEISSTLNSVNIIYMYYKLGQTLYNLGSFIITNWGNCCYKLGQLLKSRATVITK